MDNYPYKKMYYNKMKNLVLSGTHLSIITYIGTINIIEQYFNIKNYYACALSSVLALLLVLNYSSQEILQIYKDIKWDEIINIKNYDITNLIHNYCIYDGNIITDLIRKFIIDKKFDENITLLELYNKTHKSLNIVVSNLTSLEQELLNYKTKPEMTVVKAIEIGITIPFFTKPIKYNNEIFI